MQLIRYILFSEANFWKWPASPAVYSEPSEVYKIELFAEIVNRRKSLTFSAKSSILAMS